MHRNARRTAITIAIVGLFVGTSLMPLVAAEPELREPTEAEIASFVAAWVLRIASPVELEAWWNATLPDAAGDGITPGGKFLMAQRLRQNLTAIDVELHDNVYPPGRTSVWLANERFLDYVLNATAFDPAGFKASFAPDLTTPAVADPGPSPLDDVRDVLDDLGLPVPPVALPDIPDADLDALDPLLNPPVDVPGLPWDGIVPFAPQVELPLEPGALVPPLPPLPLPPLPPVPAEAEAADGVADGQPASNGAAAAAQYKACGRMVGFEAVCGEWVAVGTPVPLNLDDEAGSEVGVLLTPATARPLTDAIASAGQPDLDDRLAFVDPAVAAASRLPGAAEDLAGQVGGAGVMLLIRPLPATPCDVSVGLEPLDAHVACSTVIQGVPDLADVEQATQQQAVPALVWIKYPVVTLPDGTLESLRNGSEPGAVAKLVELGVDGTGDRLPNATQVDFRIRSIAELAQGNLTADLNFSFEDPPASIALVASVKNSTANGAPEDPTNLTVAFTPVPNLNLSLEMALDGSRINATLNASLSPVVDLTVHSERAEPYLRRNVQASIDTLPQRVTVTYERLADGNLVVYNSSAPIARTTVQFDEDTADSAMAGNVTVHELPSRILVELHTDDDEQGSAHYEAAGVIPRVEADFALLNKTDSNRTAGTADVHDIPARFDVTWNTTGTPDVFTFDASSSLGPVDLDLATQNVVDTSVHGLAIDAHIEGLPPYIGIEMDDDYSLDARTSAEGERASASIGLIEARFGTRGAFPAGPCTGMPARVCLDLDNTTTPSAAAADVRLEGIRSFAFRNETQPGDVRKTQFLDFNTTKRSEVTLSVVSRDHDDDFVDVHGTIGPLPEHVDLTIGDRIVFHSSHVFDVQVAADIGKKAILDALEAPKTFPQGISVTTQAGQRNATRAIAAITGVGTYLEVAPEDKSFRMDAWEPYTGAPGPSQDLLFHVHGFPDPNPAAEDKDEILVELTVRDPAPGQLPQDLRGSFVSRDQTLAEILGVPPNLEPLQAEAGKLTNVSLQLARAIDPAGDAPAVEASITIGSAFAKFDVSNVPEEVYFQMRAQDEVAATEVHPGLGKETFVDITAQAQIDAAHLEVDLRPDPNLLTIFDLQQVPTVVNLHLANNTAGPLIFLNVSQETLDLQGTVQVWDEGHPVTADPSLHLRLTGVNLGDLTTTIVPGDLERDIEQVSQCEYIEKEPPKPAKDAYVLTSTPKSDQLYVEVNVNATKVIDAALRWCPIDGRLLAIKFFAGFFLDIDIRIEKLSLLLDDLQTVRLKPGFIMEVEGKFSKAVVDWGESQVIAESDIGAGVNVCFPVVGFCTPAYGLPGIDLLPTIPIRPHFWVAEVHLDNLAVPTAAVTPCLPVPWPPFGARLGINVVLPLEMEPHPHGTVPTALPELIPADPEADTLWVLLVDPAPLGNGLYPWWAADLFFLIYVLATTDAGGIGFEFEFPIDPFVEECSLL